jgi:uncharacterized membrane protein YidH (DUF202 family)
MWPVIQNMVNMLCSPDNAHIVILVIITLVSVGLIVTGWYSNQSGIDKAEKKHKPMPKPDPYTLLYTQIGTWVLMLCLLAVVFKLIKSTEKPQ